MHTANELEDVGFRVVSLVNTLPADADWQQGAIGAPGFPDTALWAELEAEPNSILPAEPDPRISTSRALGSPSSSRSASPLHPYAVDAHVRAKAVVEGRA